MEYYGGGTMPHTREAVPRIIERMEVVFKGDPDLLEKFRAFTPGIGEG